MIREAKTENGWVRGIEEHTGTWNRRVLQRVACRSGDSYGRRLFVPECVDKCKDCR